MKLIKTSNIIIENRQRRLFDEKKLADLATSIRTKGLQHPIVLRNDEQTLVAGERRLRAIGMLRELGVSFSHDGAEVPDDSIPYVCVGDLTEDDLVEAELEENILREDLTWEEEAAAIAQLHRLRTGQNPQHTYIETAKEIVGDKSTSNAQKKVRESLVLSEYLDNPEVKKAKSSKEAMKIVKKIKSAEFTAQLASQFDIEQTPHIFNEGDFRDYNHYISAGSVDVICTDPPYGIDADDFGDQASNAHGYEDSEEYFQEIMQAFIVEANRVTKEKAHMYLFCDPRRFDYLANLFARYSWSVWAVPLIWHKGNGMLPEPDYGPRRVYETILYANKGRRKTNAVYHDVIDIPGVQNPRFGAEKPFELYENLLKRSSHPGDLIWDPFVGAGPVFPAANKLNLRVVGTELIPDKFNYAKLRLKEGL